MLNLGLGGGKGKTRQFDDHFLGKGNLGVTKGRSMVIKRAYIVRQQNKQGGRHKERFVYVAGKSLTYEEGNCLLGGKPSIAGGINLRALSQRSHVVKRRKEKKKSDTPLKATLLSPHPYRTNPCSRTPGVGLGWR